VVGARTVVFVPCRFSGVWVLVGNSGLLLVSKGEQARIWPLAQLLLPLAQNALAVPPYLIPKPPSFFHILTGLKFLI